MLLFVIPYIIIIYSLRKEVDIMNYISVKAASEKWGISERRIQKLCEENRIDGTEKFGRAWMIPKDAEKPVDGRMKTRNKQEENGKAAKATLTLSRSSVFLNSFL